MTARPIADYNVRLRYYFVQAIALRRKMKEYPARRPRYTKQIHAVRDWTSSQARFLRILNQYDESTWTEAAREAILAMLAKCEKTVESRFTEMSRYLLHNEALQRGVPPMLRDELDWSNKHHVAAWAMQSSFMHGDQAVVSDVIDFSPEGEPTGQIHLRPPYEQSRRSCSQPLDHATQLMRPMALVRPVGWIMNEEGLRQTIGRLYWSKHGG